MASDGIAPYVPDYASYNWTGAPSNYDLTTNVNTGGNSRMCSLVFSDSHPPGAFDS